MFFDFSAVSHLYSPNVPSSSFIGWISGSWCASSFSFTVDCTCMLLFTSNFYFISNSKCLYPNNWLCKWALPGYLPPLFLLMKHTMSKTKMRRAIAHISPMNQPWVAMSTWRLAAAGWNTVEDCQPRLAQVHSEPWNWKLLPPCWVTMNQKWKVKYRQWWVKMVWGAFKGGQQNDKSNNDFFPPISGSMRLLLTSAVNYSGLFESECDTRWINTKMMSK